MMVRRVKFGKIAIVIFLTVLIWVWADLALEETLPDRLASLDVKESADSRLWVSFGGAASRSFKITLAGPHSAISKQDKETGAS